MKIRVRGLLPAAMLSVAFLVSGCESSEERAERYYQSGLALLEAGDVDRALVEFRNVFKYNGFHKEARQTYANIQLERGEVSEAYSQYLRLIEQYPDTFEVRLSLAEIAIERGDWDEAERHGRAAFALDSTSAGSQAVNAALDYRAALLAKNADGIAAAITTTRALLEAEPDNLVARRVMIDYLASSDDPVSALPDLDAAIALAPQTLEFHIIKLRILSETGDTAGVGAQLQAMFEVFPDNEKVRGSLISWYLQQGDTDGAEAFLRRLALDAGDDPSPHIAVVQLLQSTKGAQAAQTELQALIAANSGSPNADLYRALSATIDFEAGKRPEAIAAFEEILRTAPASEQTRTIKSMLARMLALTGNTVGARARVEEILAEDATQVDALKMRAGWLIEDDKPGEAIVDLRAALDQAPQDASILTLMAVAHERDGAPELAGERLALAVEVSGAAPDESLRYARFLVKDGRGSVAESVLTDALRVNPTNVPLLTALAEQRLAANDFDRVQDTLAQLRSIDSDSARTAADAVQAALMLGQNKTEESIAFLQGMIDQGEGNLSAVALILQTQIKDGKTAEARTYLDQAIVKDPENPGLQMLSANLHALSNEPAAAETIYRALIARDPTAEQPVRGLYTLLRAAQRGPEATAALDAALAANPKSGTLRWMKAGELEAAGDIDGAIRVYEELYAENSANLVVANNLASMITTHRDDPESLERAFAIARRLRGAEVPAFQDTYGWIEYRRGNITEALAHLEPAAKGLPNDPLTQFHLGMAYVAAERPAEARAALERALELAADSKLPQFQTARDTLVTLAAAPAEAPAPAAATTP